MLAKSKTRLAKPATHLLSYHFITQEYKTSRHQDQGLRYATVMDRSSCDCTMEAVHIEIESSSSHEGEASSTLAQPKISRIQDNSYQYTKKYS